ncbi:glyoxalase superfamily protein [Roseivivax sp. CAU 1753]
MTGGAEPRFGASVPILRSFSELETRDFYLRFLGFDVRFEHRFGPGMPLYMGLRRGDAQLHLSEHHGDATPISAVRIEVAGLDAFLDEITNRGHPRARPAIQMQDWGDREIILMDPSGNRLVFWTGV